MALVLAATGMRRGEVGGLRWRDIDFDDESISVVQTLAGLRAHRRRQTGERLKLGTAWEMGYDLAFPNEIGAPLHPDRLHTAFERVVRRSDLPAIRLHDLRYS